MRALFLEKDDSGFRAGLRELADTELATHAADGDVTVRIEWSTLNYKDGPLDTLTVRVETQRGESPDGKTAGEASAALAHAIKTFIGVSAQIQIEPTGAIERSVGKAKRVIDKRAPSKGV